MHLSIFVYLVFIKKEKNYYFRLLLKQARAFINCIYIRLNRAFGERRKCVISFYYQRGRNGDRQSDIL